MLRGASKLVAPLLLTLALAACSSSNGVSIPAAPQNPTPQQPESLMRVGNYDLIFNGPTGRMERGHIMHVRGGFPASSSTNLNWNGGPIQAHPKIFLIFWGWSGASAPTADPSSEAPYLLSYMDGVGGASDSGWLNTVTQYYGPVGVFVGATGSPAGTWYDHTNSLPRRVKSSDIANEAVRAAAHFGYSADGAYIVATPHKNNTSGFGTSFCAWHSSTSSTSGPVAYTNLPYITDAGASCGEGSVNNPGTLDGVSIVGGHELAETQTDPRPSSGWTDSSGAEIGDKCAWINLQDYRFSTGSFPIQPLWDNKISGCAISGP